MNDPKVNEEHGEAYELEDAEGTCRRCVVFKKGNLISVIQRPNGKWEIANPFTERALRFICFNENPETEIPRSRWDGAQMVPL